MKDKILFRLARMVPRTLCQWVFIRVVSHATTGAHSKTVVPEITAMDCLKRWQQPN